MNKNIYWERFKSAVNLDKRNDGKELAKLLGVTEGAVYNWNTCSRKHDYEKIFTL